MATTPLQHVIWAYHHADKLSAEKYPYVFGGGHPYPYLPWVKWNSTFSKVIPAEGPDCSGGIDNILWYAGLLNEGPEPATKEAQNTEWLEKWGESGEGQYFTVWVINESGVMHHAFLDFKIPNYPHRWWAATHTGGPVGWQDEWGDWITKGFHPRHFKGG